MQLSYNLIRKDQTLELQSKSISTNYIKEQYIEKELTKEDIKDEESQTSEGESSLESLYKINATIIEEGRKEREKIIVQAYEEGKKIEKEAYEKGYALGEKNGYEDGQREIVQHILPEAESKAKEILDEASKVLLKAKEDYESYMEEKKEEIIQLSLEIARKILRAKVEEEESLNELVEEAVKLSRGEENIIIKCNPLYVKELESQISSWKVKYSIKGEIFIMASELINKGDGIIDKNSGSITVGLSYGLEEIEKALFN